MQTFKNTGNGVLFHVLDQVLELRTDRRKGFGQSGFFINAVHRKINGSETRITKTVDHVGFHQPPIRRQVNDEVFLGSVVNDFVDKLRPQERFASHEGEEPIAEPVQPVDGLSGSLLGHSLNAIVIGPAVMTIEVAFPFAEQI